MSKYRKWSEDIFVFRSMRVESVPRQLILELDDGTERMMNYHNWEDDFADTEKKLYALKPGERIRIETWRTDKYSPQNWFCDVEKI